MWKKAGDWRLLFHEVGGRHCHFDDCTTLFNLTQMLITGAVALHRGLQLRHFAVVHMNMRARVQITSAWRVLPPFAVMVARRQQRRGGTASEINNTAINGVRLTAVRGDIHKRPDIYGKSKSRVLSHFSRAEDSIVWSAGVMVITLNLQLRDEVNHRNFAAVPQPLLFFILAGLPPDSVIRGICVSSHDDIIVTEVDIIRRYSPMVTRSAPVLYE